MEERIVELEIRFTEQQATLQELSEVLIAHQKDMDVLKSKVALLEQKLQAEPGLVDASDRERPPHY
ncbi:MAG: SlyX family protein [Myxococcaceae bacterium]